MSRQSVTLNIQNIKHKPKHCIDKGSYCSRGMESVFLVTIPKCFNCSKTHIAKWKLFRIDVFYIITNHGTLQLELFMYITEHVNQMTYIYQGSHLIRSVSVKQAKKKKGNKLTSISLAEEQKQVISWITIFDSVLISEVGKNCSTSN